MKQAIAVLCLLAAALASRPVFTQVTCLYDIKRDSLQTVAKRSFD